MPRILTGEGPKNPRRCRQPHLRRRPVPAEQTGDNFIAKRLGQREVDLAAIILHP